MSETFQDGVAAMVRDDIWDDLVGGANDKELVQKIINACEGKSVVPHICGAMVAAQAHFMIQPLGDDKKAEARVAGTWFGTIFDFAVQVVLPTHFGVPAVNEIIDDAQTLTHGKYPAFDLDKALDSISADISSETCKKMHKKFLAGKPSKRNLANLAHLLALEIAIQADIDDDVCRLADLFYHYLHKMGHLSHRIHMEEGTKR